MASAPAQKNIGKQAGDMATLRELAECTGFSITTISRVLNDDPTMSVSDSTRAAILEAAGRLHYRPAPKPRRTQPGGALRIAVAEQLSPVEQLSDPYYLYLKNYAVQRCRDLGIAVAALTEGTTGYVADTPHRIDGVLAIGIFSPEQIERLSRLSENVVFLDSSPDELRFDSVVLDFGLGIRQALDDLIARGHRRIGFLGPDRKLDQHKRPAPEVRRQCYIRYMQEHGLYDPALLIHASMDAMDARRALTAHIRDHGLLATALLAANEECAIGAAGALRSADLRVPEDLSLISFNDTALSALTDPPLTSVSTHVEVMSAAAVDLLVRRISLSVDSLPLKIVVPPTLIHRESVAGPKA